MQMQTRIYISMRNRVETLQTIFLLFSVCSQINAMLCLNQRMKSWLQLFVWRRGKSLMVGKRVSKPVFNEINSSKNNQRNWCNTIWWCHVCSDIVWVHPRWDVYLVTLNTDMIAAHSYPILILQHPMLGPSLQDSNDTRLSDSKNEF